MLVGVDMRLLTMPPYGFGDRILMQGSYGTVVSCTVLLFFSAQLRLLHIGLSLSTER